MDSITIPESFLMSLLGMAVVFAVLVILMTFITIMSRVTKKQRGEASAPAGPAAAPAEVRPAEAPGSAGSVKTFGVPDRTAAMIMAIVADKLDAPLNRLRFLSIRETDGKQDGK